MRYLGFVCLALAAIAPDVNANGIPHSEYKQRRAALRKAIPDGLVILFGATEKDHGDLRSPFFQEANFYYLTGWSEPGAIVVIAPEEEMLFIPKRDTEQEKWTGPKIAPGDSTAITATGFDRVAAVESFESHVPRWLENAKRVYTLTAQPAADRLRRLLPLRELSDITGEITKLR